MGVDFELKLSLAVVVFLGGVYVVYELVALPSGGHPFGHVLGILGSVLMVMTEVLYSARKRLSFFRFGEVRHWLSFHIFTGIVGPALVLMHTGFQFRGLAGLTTALTALIVASGFLGRYIYTAVPRSLAGVEVDRRTLEVEAQRRQAELAAWAADKPARLRELVLQAEAVDAGGADLPALALLARRMIEWREQRRVAAAIRGLEQAERARAAEIEKLLRRQRQLVRQIRSLETVRRFMGWWHMAHVPLGLTLFTAMAIHVVAVVYYGAL